MSIQEVVVDRREQIGKGPSKRLRKTGKIPSVVYGYGGETISVTVAPKDIDQIIHSERGLNAVLNLRLAGTEETRHVMIKNIDRHPVTDSLIHVDFLRINMDQKITATIPIEFDGTPTAVKLGGIMTIVRRDVEIECLPKDLLGAITVDVSGLEMDVALRVGDLPEYDGVTYLLGPERMVAVVHPPEQEEVTDEEDEDEVIEEEAVEEAPQE